MQTLPVLEAAQHLGISEKAVMSWLGPFSWARLVGERIPAETVEAIRRNTYSDGGRAATRTSSGSSR